MKIRLLAVALALASNAGADIDVRAIASAMAKRPSSASATPGIFERARLGAIVEVPESDDPVAFGLPRVGSRFGVARGSLSELVSLGAAHPGWRMTWSPPLRPLLDKAAAWSRVPQFRNDTGVTGKGAVVGIVDEGIDVTHPDFQNPDGTTRIAWLVDFSRNATGNHPEENICRCGKLTCDGSAKAQFHCAIFTGSELDALVASGSDRVPTDPGGHGTHVASLAAGNGGTGGKYVGMAPEASLIVASVADTSGTIDSAVIPLATSIVFDLAEELGQSAGLERLPAVVNVSLGNDFGNHDGTSAIERSLAGLVGSDHPGRVIVAAAGNSAGEYIGKSAYPTPLGIHTEVDVTERSSLRVPLLTTLDPSKVTTLNGQIFVWISFRPGDVVSVGVDQEGLGIPFARTHIVDPVPPGQTAELTGIKGSSPDVTIVNGALKKTLVAPEDQNAAAVVLDGSWPSSTTFAIRLEGQGSARLWVETGGRLGDQGALFPAATKDSTIAIPASSPSVIAVGATLNRTDWVDRAGNTVKIPVFGSVKNPKSDSVAFFSGAGPTSDLRMKPDIVAPGAFVVGAMATAADPEINDQSDFAATTACANDDPACAAVDDEHGVLAGTSMASPIVAGAVALLLAEKPGRTQDDILTLLQAGARFPEGLVRYDAQLGPGALDLEGVRDVELAADAPVLREPVADKSWMILGETFAHPDSAWRIPAVLELRNANGRIADGFDPSLLTVEADNGTLVDPVTRAAPGLYRFGVSANAETGGEVLRVSAVYRHSIFLEKDLPIAVDVNVLREGFSARGGCDVARRTGREASFAPGAVALILSLRTRRRSVARRARSRDRTGTSGRSRRG